MRTLFRGNRSVESVLPRRASYYSRDRRTTVTSSMQAQFLVGRAGLLSSGQPNRTSAQALEAMSESTISSPPRLSLGGDSTAICLSP